ncbi:hypothetical protein IEQ34_022064 [Dendrobium chrysotoxum]|uniref:Uncharacterized protein n=1 Tax=Dendrobium chrysotoxum TaxID=161865 RepID=A0AAV7FXW7_DENCH|nr:hypothetical protein IEQ34_022064 [Dendrobium chrysotoxum]
MRAISVNSRSFFRFCCSDLAPSLRFRSFSSEVGGRNSNSSFESGDDFERRLFGDVGNSADTGSFFRKLDKIEQAHGRSFNSLRDNDGGNSRFMDGQGEGFDTLSDGMDSKLKKAANTFAFTDEIKDDDYKFRPDVTFRPGTTYTLRLDEDIVSDFDMCTIGDTRDRRPRSGVYILIVYFIFSVLLFYPYGWSLDVVARGHFSILFSSFRPIYMRPLTLYERMID